MTQTSDTLLRLQDVSKRFGKKTALDHISLEIAPGRIFRDFYTDFDAAKAEEMLQKLDIDPSSPLKTLSKGTREKVQLIMVMSRRAKVYILDEPIAGVDPAARDYILKTIIQDYSEDASILLSTHLIADVEQLLDDVIFLKDGQIILSSSVEEIRDTRHQSVDSYFREVFSCSQN